MRVLADGKWSDGFLDYHRDNDQYRVSTVLWRTFTRVGSQYFVRPKSVRFVYNYLREVGAREVSRKVISRSLERLRNDKYVSCGVGRIVQGEPSGELECGQYVIFLAPNHPLCVERLVLPAGLLYPVQESFLLRCGIPSTSEHSLLYHSSELLREEAARRYEPLAGWSPFSGRALPPETMELLEEGRCLIETTNWAAAIQLPISPATPIRERHEIAQRHGTDRRKTAVLIGYGNYAKTIILPNTRQYLQVNCVHELDPAQVPPKCNAPWDWDSAPAPRADKHYDAWLIASYHHTHAALAVNALRMGSYAVVEKPLVVDECQLDLLAKAVRESPRLFAGFHKRYSPMNAWARHDLRLKAADAVSYHCIVYEVPLPRRHWYRWPTAHSRIVSNGCHWIDHFLFLNSYAAVENLDVQQSSDDTVSCFVTLCNGACFTMVLTDQGAMRTGVQDYVELRANGATVRMVDGAVYRAEDSRRVLRRARIHKYSGFERMYQSIGRAIVNGENGDAPESVIASAKLVLALEAQLDARHS